MNNLPNIIPEKWKKSLAVGGVPLKNLLEVPVGGCLPAFGTHYIACPGQICELCDLDCGRYWDENQEALSCDQFQRQDGQGIHFVEFVTQGEQQKKNNKDNVE